MNPPHKQLSFFSAAFDEIGDGKKKLPTIRWLEHFPQSCSDELNSRASGLFGFWLRFGSVTGFFKPAPSPKPRQKPKILAAHRYIFSVNALVIACAMVATFLTGCATTDDTGRPLSANGQPLQLQMIQASTTSEDQTFYEGMVLPNFAATVAAGPVDSTYNGPGQDIYKKYVPKQGESFLIVEFKISGVLKTLQLMPEDGYIIDGKGGLHKAMGVEFPDKKWYPFSFMTISPDDSKADQVAVSGMMTFTLKAEHRLKSEKWIFSMPRDSVSGATIHFQEKSYPLEINK